MAMEFTRSAEKKFLSSFFKTCVFGRCFNWFTYGSYFTVTTREGRHTLIVDIRIGAPYLLKGTQSQASFFFSTGQKNENTEGFICDWESKGYG
jgi:hypothetical protein